MSGVFETFVAAVAAADSDRAEAIHREAEHAEIRVSERELAMRCLTAASLAWRRLIASHHTPRPILNADDAWEEYVFAKDIPAADPAKRIFLEATLLAADRLGPMPGGYISHSRRPEQSPMTTSDAIEPTSEDLRHIGSLCGEVVGLSGSEAAISSTRLVQETAQGTLL